MTTAAEYRAQLERYLWEATEWRGDSTLIDKMLDTTEEYAKTLAPLLAQTAAVDDHAVDFVDPEPDPAPAAGEDWSTVDFGSLLEEPEEPVHVAPELVELTELPSAPLVVDDVALVVDESAIVITDVPEGEKRCRRCGLSKPRGQFHRDSKNSDGHRYLCKPCDSETKRDWKKRRMATLSSIRIYRMQRVVKVTPT